MSAIGDYVHYHGTNYAKYGIYKRDQGKYMAYDFNTQKQSVRDRIEQNTTQMSGGEMETLQEQIGSLLAGSAAEGTKEAEIQNRIYEEMSKEFLAKLGDIDWATGDVTRISASTLLQDKSAALTELNYKKNKQGVRVSTVNKRVAGINELLKKLSQGLPSTNLTTLQSAVDSINKEWEKICTEAEEQLQDANMTLEQLLHEDPLIDLTQPHQSFFKSVNDVIKAMVGAPPISLEKGELLEYIVACAGYLAADSANQSLEDFLKQKVGQETHTVAIQMDNFTEELNPDALGLVVEYDNGSRFLVDAQPQRREGQNKMDVQLTLGDSRTAGVSVKNYNLASNQFGIHVLGDSSLLYLIQDESPDFVNHYLNLVATHPDSWSGGMAMQLTAAREAMKATIAWKALSGETLNNKNVDVFVLNDNSKSGIDSIKIVSIADIGRKMLDGTEALSNITVTANGVDLSQIRFTNEWSNTSYSERISNLLKHVRALKISVALNPSLI